MKIPRRRKKPEMREAECGTDALSRDIAALLAYTIPGKEGQDAERETDE